MKMQKSSAFFIFDYWSVLTFRCLDVKDKRFFNYLKRAVSYIVLIYSLLFFEKNKPKR